MKEDNGVKSNQNVTVAYPVSIKVSGGKVQIGHNPTLNQLLLNGRLKHINMKRLEVIHKL